MFSMRFAGIAFGLHGRGGQYGNLGEGSFGGDQAGMC